MDIASRLKVYIYLSFVESFLQCNAESFRSLGANNVNVISQRKYIYLALAQASDMTGLASLIGRRLNKLSCSCSYRGDGSCSPIMTALLWFSKLGKGTRELHKAVVAMVGSLIRDLTWPNCLSVIPWCLLFTVWNGFLIAVETDKVEKRYPRDNSLLS